MKYCKKCFRNVREDVDVCPFCGAPGLEEYGSSSSGENFSCSRPMEVKSSIEEEAEELEPKDYTQDAYSMDDNSPFSILDDVSERDAYGNVIDNSDACNKVGTDAYGSTKHNDENCDNAPDTPSATMVTRTLTIGNTDTDNRMRVEYLRMLKKIDGITKERIDELMKSYDEQHSGQNFKKTIYRTYTTGNSQNGQSAYIPALIITMIILVFGVFSPILGIVMFLFARKFFKKSTDPKIQKLSSVSTVLIILFIFLLIFMNSGIISAFTNTFIYNI